MRIAKTIELNAPTERRTTLAWSRGRVACVKAARPEPAPTLGEWTKKNQPRTVGF